MGQYYRLVNKDKKEWIEGHKIGTCIKAWEWAASNKASVLVLLLLKTNSSGGGDPDWNDPDIAQVAGRWAGDRIEFVGDYYARTKDDKSETPNYYRDEDPEFDDLNSPEWAEISDLVIPAWNKFIELPEYKIARYVYATGALHTPVIEGNAGDDADYIGHYRTLGWKRVLCPDCAMQYHPSSQCEYCEKSGKVWISPGKRIFTHPGGKLRGQWADYKVFVES